jgi:tRNA (adenine22-N1)-methyltransferase
MGPLLLRGTDETFRRKWEFELAKRENIRERLRLSQSEEATQKALEWERTIANIKEVLACWPAARR